MSGQITISNEANRLYRTCAHEIGEGEQAIHVVWVLNKDREGGHWRLGFSPVGQFRPASSADQKVLDYIVAGRCREILVVVDGPMPKAAKDMMIDIDTTDGVTFNVTVSE
jgi:hypothetical protein